MIIKTETAIVDTNTYDSFFIECRESRGDYRLGERQDENGQRIYFPW